VRAEYQCAVAAPYRLDLTVSAAAFIARRHRETLLSDASLRLVTGSLLAIAILLVSIVALLGVFVNKVAPVW
jgi:hypothetical protein